MFQGAAHGGQQLIAFKRLEQVVVSAFAHRGNGDADVLDGRYHHHRRLRLIDMQALQQADAVAVAHHHVGKHQVEMLAVDQVEGFRIAGGQTVW
jgi:hypothetical protein